jgi:histone deacetylase complex regulatory component SIN3
VKKRFSKPEQLCIYKDFLKALHKYQVNHRSADVIDIVSAEVRVLFAEHPDLIAEFTTFLPVAASNASSSSSTNLPTDLPSISAPSETPKLPEPIFWVKCDDCNRWRIINGLTLEEQSTLQKASWFCRLHPDVTQRDCDKVSNVSARCSVCVTVLPCKGYCLA